MKTAENQALPKNPPNPAKLQARRVRSRRKVACKSYFYPEDIENFRAIAKCLDVSFRRFLYWAVVDYALTACDRLGLPDISQRSLGGEFLQRMASRQQLYRYSTNRTSQFRHRAHLS